VAINIGDYLIGKGYQLMSGVPCDPEIRARCLAVVSASHLKLSEGQGADILMQKNRTKMSVEDVLEIFELKTGEAVKVALLMGAIAGNAAESELVHLARFSEYFGIAYQIRDDLNEFREENKNKHAFDFPFLLTLLNVNLNGQSPGFSDLLKSEDLELLFANFKEFNIEEKAEKYLGDYIRKCHGELNKLQNLKLRLSLYGVMGKVFKQ